ncbi:MAG: hypothetical protein LLG37_05105 [Spirochaetia bacterium]|nr:hypothetical protein [Spirochaetia bacterium]
MNGGGRKYVRMDFRENVCCVGGLPESKHGFPGIGLKLAAVLIEKYGCVKNVFNLDLKILQETPGIGRIKAEKSMRTLSGEEV